MVEINIDKLNNKGKSLLEIEDPAEARNAFDKWVSEVAEELMAFAPESDLTEEWQMLGGSDLVAGTEESGAESNWWRFRMAVNKRLFWLSRLPTKGIQTAARNNGGASSEGSRSQDKRTKNDRSARTIDHIVTWLGDYCDKAGLNGFVVGVSGGIDSAVTSTLCAKTGKPVILLNMPIHQAPEQVALASRHIKWLTKSFDQVKGVYIDLNQVLMGFENCLPDDIQDNLTMANTRSRIRMTTLYSFAGHHRMLVTGTGNKVEDFGVGFFTKYGDGGVDISPIADLLKSEVYDLGRELGIIDDILAAPPTDGLWADNRTDENQIGASYAELEWAMQYESSGGDEPTLGDREKEILQIYRRFHNANRHKMEPIPVCQNPYAGNY